MKSRGSSILLKCRSRLLVVRVVRAVWVVRAVRVVRVVRAVRAVWAVWAAWASPVWRVVETWVLRSPLYWTDGS
jgi:hypothetical protein